MASGEAEKLYVLPRGSAYSTFRLDTVLPSLPLPTLDATLAKYLDSVQPLVSAEELAQTQGVVQRFQEGVGKDLHWKLAEKASKSRNWVESWWEEFGYHRIRTPLLPFCSMDGVFPADMAGSCHGPDDQIRNGSMLLYHQLEFWQLLRHNRLRPSQSADKKTTFSMAQFRRLYNTVRVPGPEVDSIVSYFNTSSEGHCPSHVVIVCRGRMFRVEALDQAGTVLSPPEWATILRRVRNECERRPAQEKVPVLTCDDRTSWSKNRKRLMELSAKNAALVGVLESAVLHIVLDSACPDSDSAVSNCSLRGASGDRWADKSLLGIAYGNGRLGGVSEHSAYDGLASITMMHYCVVALEDSRGGWQGRMDVRPDVLHLQELILDLDVELRAEIKRVTTMATRNSEDVNMTRNQFSDFGKKEIQRCKLHPDAFMQMALQLAYHRVHGRAAPCYETATTRGFFNGRTETVRPCTQECLAWVTSMLSNDSSVLRKQQLLRDAIAKHEQLMAEARDGWGCDRHLFGLYCTALEEGLPIPDLFNDPAYTKSGGGGNFVLSTSLTGYTPCGGGVAPMVTDGYGVFYCITPTWITATVSTYNSSSETDADKFFLALGDSLRDMRDLMLPAPPSRL